MARSVRFISALSAVADAQDDSSLLQMPIANVNLEVDKDADECRCPGYFEAQCVAEAAQGCVWSAQGTDNGAHWCQCLNPDTRPPPGTSTAPPVTAPPVTAPPVTASPVTAPPDLQACGSEWVSGGKSCGDSGCINGNQAYDTLEEAWAQCEQDSACGSIMRWTNDMYYCRRSTDPSAAGGSSLAYCLGMPLSQFSLCSIENDWVFGGKGCPSGDCLNGNTPYDTLEEAWAQCEQVSECGNILEWTDGNYYLRRDTDPDVANGRRLSFCLGAEPTPTRCASGEAQPEWVSGGKSCGDSGCINGNQAYDTLEEAWAQCEQDSACGSIMRWTNDMYYCRRSTDPSAADGSSLAYCLGMPLPDVA